MCFIFEPSVCIARVVDKNNYTALMLLVSLWSDMAKLTEAGMVPWLLHPDTSFIPINIAIPTP